jgi:hypothetical protein
MIFALIASSTRSYTFRRYNRKTFLVIVIFFAAFSARAQQDAVAPIQDETTQDIQKYYAAAHAYINEPFEQLVKRIPELDGLQPAADQQDLAGLLRRTAQQVDESFRDIVDLSGYESIVEEKLNGFGDVVARQQVEASYLILRRGPSVWGRVDEYRMDAKGEHAVDAGAKNGYFVTSNFALMRAYFGTVLQPQMEFRYLGEQSVGSRKTYVVAFAQKPAEASMPITLEGDGAYGHYRVQMLLQGLAWIDAESAQILRMRTDLLAPRPEIGLDSVTTTVTSSEFRLPDVAAPLWLPASVEVRAHFTYEGANRGESRVEAFRNEHQYSGYELYRVSARMIPEAAPLSVSDLVGPGNSEFVMTAQNAAQSYYAGVHPYFEAAPAQLIERIPELKKIQVATDQAALLGILKKAGLNVDDHFSNLVDLIAHEKITMQRSLGKISSASQRIEDNYLILRESHKQSFRMVEYRMDAAGHRLDNVGINLGYLVSRGFAMTSNFFASGWQHESDFRYLGDQRIDSRETYVVGLAQKPALATLVVTMKGPNDVQYPVLVQGIAWIDKSNMQIVRMRTDLLAPHPELGLERQTTDVIFSEVRLADVAAALWLPKDVKVNVVIKGPDSENRHRQEIQYRNEHHYSDYRRYRVSVKMVSPQ